MSSLDPLVKILQKSTQGNVYDLQHEKISFFDYAKTKVQISCALTAQLIRAFVFTTWIVQSLFFLNHNHEFCSVFFSSVTVQTGQCQTWPETTKTDFLRMCFKT